MLPQQTPHFPRFLDPIVPGYLYPFLANLPYHHLHSEPVHRLEIQDVFRAWSPFPQMPDIAVVLQSYFFTIWGRATARCWLFDIYVLKMGVFRGYIALFGPEKRRIGHSLDAQEKLPTFCSRKSPPLVTSCRAVFLHSEWKMNPGTQSKWSLKLHEGPLDWSSIFATRHDMEVAGKGKARNSHFGLSKINFGIKPEA